MSRFGTRLILMLLLIVLGIFIGVDMATKGTERIHGPFNHHETAESSATSAQSGAESSVDNFESSAEENEKQSAVDHFSDRDQTYKQSKFPLWIGNTLQSIARKGIEWIGSILDWFL